MLSANGSYRRRITILVTFDSRCLAPGLVLATTSIKSSVYARNRFKNPLRILQSENLYIADVPSPVPERRVAATIRKQEVLINNSTLDY
jgi:hypothetical protein